MDTYPAGIRGPMMHRTAIQRSFFFFFNSHEAAGLSTLSVKEKYPAESSFLSGKGNSDLYAF